MQCCEYSGNSCAICSYTSKSSLIKQKHSLSIHSLHTYLHSIFTSPTTRLRSSIKYDGRHHSERHSHMSRCHICRSPDSNPIGLRRTSQRITPIIPDGADHRRINSIPRYLVLFARHHSRREQIRCRASDRYIFFSIGPFTILIPCIEPRAL